ncbi:MAG: efflux RND transporter permease subunit [Novosphingobium sp.]|nr:efflux RND transporter permease subunit [Novosphingobium sp.]
MIAAIIRASVRARNLVLLAALVLTVAGVAAVRSTPVDALPDLSDVQVIIRTSYPGQAPQIVENQVTYPISSTMLSVPGARVVRGYSFTGDSFVYILFDDQTDLYWARSRVLEYLSQVQTRLPEGAKPSLGPDATGVGWIFEYALVDRSGRNDLSQLRSLQDWFLRFELKTVPGVAEVASIGGMVRQYQVVVDPQKLAAYRVTATDVQDALKRANQETGGATIEMAGAEYTVRSSGYLKSLDDFRSVPLRAAPGGIPVTIGDVATVQVGPEMRRGVAELNGEGEVAGGVIVMRQGQNARVVIEGVKTKLEELKRSLPPGVEIVTTYDRSGLIDRAVENLNSKLLEEFAIVALVCAIFLWHARSALVAILTLPLGILIAFIAMRLQGLNANILSLGGIAIAIGAMVDAAVVMIENAHKHLERWHHEHPEDEPDNATRWELVTVAAAEVGPALFLSLLIITFSFLPIFTLQGQEGRLFAPLAFTKTYAMAGAALLSITLIPVLMGLLIRGKIPNENANPINRWLTRIYQPAIDWVIRRPKQTLICAGLVFATTLWPYYQIGGEFLPKMNEGDLLYMPSALPPLSAAEAGRLLQKTDRLIKTVPEVKSVFGKAGRAESATDPAPLEMFETTIQFKPRDQWRPGMTPEKLIEELDSRVKVPGLANFWIPPIRNRIDMLATGIKSPIGIKVAGSNIAEIDATARRIESVVKRVPGVTSALAERLTGGRYIDVQVDRIAAARLGLNVADVQAVVSGVIGGETVGQTVEGLARYPISVRYPRELRDTPEKLAGLPVLTPGGQQITLGSVARIRVSDGPPMLRSENGRPVTWLFVDGRDVDMQTLVTDINRAIASEVKLPAGVSVSYTGQYEFLVRAKERMKLVVPITLVIIFALLYLTFRRWDEALLIMATLPFALTGGLWLLYWLGYNQSVATAVGFIALAGVSAEFGVVMLIYLKHALEAREDGNVADAVREGALLRVRPKAMTVAVILAGLFPVLVGGGAGSEVMSRIAAPMVGGMLTAPLLSMLIVPAAYLLMRRKSQRLAQPDPPPS